jgi:hypothetical protein
MELDKENVSLHFSLLSRYILGRLMYQDFNEEEGEEQLSADDNEEFYSEGGNSELEGELDELDLLQDDEEISSRK